MDTTQLTCPNCGHPDVAVSHVQLFMVNTGEHYCHSVKPHDSTSESHCLKCQWQGVRAQLVPQTMGGSK